MGVADGERAHSGWMGEAERGCGWDVGADGEENSKEERAGLR